MDLFVRKTRCKSRKNISFAKRNSRIIVEAVQYFLPIPLLHHLLRLKKVALKKLYSNVEKAIESFLKNLVKVFRLDKHVVQYFGK